MSAALRSDVHGTFISEPSAFVGADSGFENAFSLLFRPRVTQEGDLGLEFDTTILLADLSAISAGSLSAEKVSVDCDLVKQVANEHGEVFQQVLVELQKGTPAGVEAAEALVQRMGLTELDTKARGGGLIDLIVAVIIIAVATGCGGANRQKVTSPAATTTPKKPGTN